MSGHVALHRSAFDHPLLRDAERFKAWFWLVAHAAWKPKRHDVHGKILKVQRGQISVSVRQLGEAWGWSKSSVERFLTRLKTETMIETETGTGRLLITICNYEKYQEVGGKTGTPRGTRNGTRAGQQRDIKEEGNKGIREEANASSGARARSIPPDFVPTLTDRAQAQADLLGSERFKAELQQFRDHHTARGTTMKDWQAAFRTWLANAVKWMRTPNGAPQNGRRPTTRESGEAVARRYEQAGSGVVDLVPRLGAAGRNDP